MSGVYVRVWEDEGVVRLNVSAQHSLGDLEGNTVYPTKSFNCDVVCILMEIGFRICCCLLSYFVKFGFNSVTVFSDTNVDL